MSQPAADFRPIYAQITELARQAAAERDAAAWPENALQRLGALGLPAWFVPRELGGRGESEADLLSAFIALARGCLTTAFVFTQYMGAVQRIVRCGNASVQEQLLPRMLGGKSLLTLGISHLTTSRQHVAQPALRAIPADGGFELCGYSPWVTGAVFADHLVLGAALDDGRQLLAAVPAGAHGVVAVPPARLLALAGSCTGRVDLNGTRVAASDLLAGPVENVLQSLGSGAGGWQTSAVAIGLAESALDDLEHEAQSRAGLAPPIAALRAEAAQLTRELLAGAQGNADVSPSALRHRANSFALRATQTALAAAKGAGFVEGHPAGRRCREALFFLVWSCPQAVVDAHMCDFAGLGEGV